MFVFKQVNIHSLRVFMADSLVRERACICECSHLSECVICVDFWQIEGVWAHLRVFKLLIIYKEGEAVMYVFVNISKHIFFYVRMLLNLCPEGASRQ